MTATPENHNSEGRRTELFDYSPDAVFIMDTHGKCIDVNITACSMLGYTREEFPTLSFRNLFFADDGTSMPPEFMKLKETGTIKTKARIIKKNNDLLPVRLNAAIMPDGKYIIFCSDISEYRQNEEILLKSRQQLCMTADHIPAPVTCICARDLTYRFVNKAFADAFRLSPEHIIDRHVREILGEEAYIRALPFIERAESGERVTHENIIHIQGEPHLYNFYYMPESDENGSVRNIIILMLDISEHRRAGEILRESENRFRLLFDQSPDLNLIITKDGIVADINAACLEVTGYRREEVIGQKYIKMPWTIRKTIPQLMSIYNEVIEGKVIREQEVVLQHKNGMSLYFELFVNPIMVDNEVKIFQVIMRDITKRKKAEEELGLSEEKFRFIVENSMMPMIIATLKDYTVIFYNSYATDFFIDTSVEGTIKANDYWVHPEERDGLVAILKEKGFVHGYEAELKTRFGEHKWCLLSAKIINYLGQPASFVMVNDISELKHVQEEREKLIEEIKIALSRVKQLSGMLPICASCKKIRNDKGYWEQIESFIRDHSEAEFSHGICPECAKRLYPGIYKGE